MFTNALSSNPPNLSNQPGQNFNYLYLVPPQIEQNNKNLTAIAFTIFYLPRASKHYL